MLGPASPKLRQIGLVLASDNTVALDTVVARLMVVDPARLVFLKKAKDFGLGEFDSGLIERDGEMQIFSNFKLPPLGGEDITGNPSIQQLLNSKAHVTSNVDPELCIACFCCQEIYPEKAMSLN